MKKPQLIDTILIIDHTATHTHPYINNILSVYLINQMFEKSLTLLIFSLNH